MKNRFLVLAAAAFAFFSYAMIAEASWTKPTHKVTAYEGFKNSANGFVNNVLPWNWFGAGKEPRPLGYVRNGRNNEN